MTHDHDDDSQHDPRSEKEQRVDELLTTLHFTQWSEEMGIEDERTLDHPLSLRLSRRLEALALDSGAPSPQSLLEALVALTTLDDTGTLRTERIAFVDGQATPADHSPSCAASVPSPKPAREQRNTEPKMKTPSVREIEMLADSAHAGQTDKIGVPYIEHVRAVAAGLSPFGDELVMVGLLHDLLEDTDWTVERLRDAGVPARVIELVQAVTNQPGMAYEEKIHRITADPQATLVKIADNAHNSHPDRAAQLPADKRERLAAKYRSARAELWSAANRTDIEAIVRIVNPSLLAELDAHH